MALFVAGSAVGGLHHRQGNSYVETPAIVLVQGAIGGPAILLFLASAFAGWRQLRGSSPLVPPVAWLSVGLVVTVVWALAYIIYYGS